MDKYSVFMTDTIFPDTEIEQEVLSGANATLTMSSDKSVGTLLDEGRDCDAMLVVYASVGAEVIEALTRCKVIVRAGIGFNNVDIEAATRAGIMVANVPDYCLDEVADHTMALFLSVARKTCFLNKSVEQGRWDAISAKPIPRLRGKTFGLIGCGAIGLEVAKRVSSFGMNVVGYDPFAPDEVFSRNDIDRIDSLDHFLASVDVVSLHVPLNGETQHIIDKESLRKMKDSSIVINSSRGGLIDECALYDAIKSGSIAGAGIDVLEKEPPEGMPPLAELDRVVMTPHAAFLSEDSVTELRRKAAQEIVRTLEEGYPKFCVNK